MQAYEKGSPAYFATPPTNLIYALHASLTAITKGSPSLEDRFQLHKDAKERIRRTLQSHGLLEVSAEPQFSANGMTAIYYPDGMGAADVIPKFAQENITLAGGLHRDIKDKYFRIGHMGVSVSDPSRGDIDRLITTLDKVLSKH